CYGAGRGGGVGTRLAGRGVATGLLNWLRIPPWAHRASRSREVRTGPDTESEAVRPPEPAAEGSNAPAPAPSTILPSPVGPPQSKRPLTPEQELTVDELLEVYDISDPVYRGLIRWRVAILQEWHARWLGNTVSVLEIGTGHYPFTLSFGTSCREMDFTGIETDANMSARARQHLADKFRSATVLSSRWNRELTRSQGWDDKFDVVTTFEVFEHVPAEEEFLINVRRVLRPGGYLILETPN